MKDPFYLHADPAFIEDLYKKWKEGANGDIDPEWDIFFQGFELALSLEKPEGAEEHLDEASLMDEIRAYQLIEAYRWWGHLIADTNPIRPRKDRGARLHWRDFGFTEEDLNRTFLVGKILGLENPTLKNIYEHLRKIYCGHIGFEFAYIHEPEIRNWLLEKIEKDWLQWSPPLELKRLIIEKLTQAEVFEQFLNTKYIGQKRFSIEGADNFIPAMELILKFGSERGVREAVIGMAHRGRINVLANILKKTYEEIFSEFEDVPPELPMGDGDVKYHRGYSATREFDGKEIYVKLMPNPSHLESVDGVVQGFSRARGQITYNHRWKEILPIMVHGDAAIAGQGVVYEVVQMARLPGYQIGGTLHFVINNQIGFTTDFDEGRSSPYATSVSMIIGAPAFHVNGDDAEAIAFAVLLAVQFRQKFQRDVFIDMVGYRKHGHNEGDDPRYTQPKLYAIISKHPSPREIYLKQLEQQGALERSLAEEWKKRYWEELQTIFKQVKENPLPYKPPSEDNEWKDIITPSREEMLKTYDTAFSKPVAKQLLEIMLQIPEGFKPLPKIKRLFEQQRKKWLEEELLDWAGAELLAYASLAYEGFFVRLDGQDSKRGTFAHRHAIIYDAETEEEYNRLEKIPGNGWFKVYNSPLSEYGVLAFSYGFSLHSPQVLAIWEAQFGDFANGAQIVIDQYISSGEDKWFQKSGVTLYLPHGYEGQGPEHSSARIERFLQLSADLNMFIANVTTPANLFHILRRQLKAPFRKPLILFTPKSLLRHPRVISPLEEIASGYFKPVLDDPRGLTSVRRVLLCQGKIFYELLEYAEKNQIADVAIVRIEQLYPFPDKDALQVIEKYTPEELVWVQEEPANMGAWWYMKVHDDVPETIQKSLKLVSRVPSASPATGFFKKHIETQKKLVELAFKPLPQTINTIG
ncbi:MAG: 2-oxoglutarate dehydrogenase E1 component [Chlorobi bacterium]|nr:2-oxoglutarate dehydrogenase E1 component [Chlorobiota bacterium]